MSFKTYKEIRPRLGFRSLWRPVAPATVRPAARHRVQRLNFSDESVTVRPAILSRSSESRFSVPNFRFSKCFETRPYDGPSCPWRSVVGFVASACFSRNKICCSKRLNRSLQIIWKLLKGSQIDPNLYHPYLNTKIKIFHEILFYGRLLACLFTSLPNNCFMIINNWSYLLND